jgi:hypothetical protein
MASQSLSCLYKVGFNRRKTAVYRSQTLKKVEVVQGDMDSFELKEVFLKRDLFKVNRKKIVFYLVFDFVN